MKYGRTWSEEEIVSDTSDADLSAQSTRGTETPVEGVCRKRRRILWDEPAGDTQDPATAESQIVLELTRELMRTKAELQEQLHRNSYLEQKVENLEKNLNVLAQQGQLEQLALVKIEEKLKVEEQEVSLTQSEEKLEEAQIISKNLKHCVLKELIEKKITVHVAQYQDEINSMKDAHDAYAALTKKIQELQEELSAKDNLVQQLNREKEVCTEEQCTLKDIVEEHEHYAARLESTIETLKQKVSDRNHLIQRLQQEKKALNQHVIERPKLYVAEARELFSLFQEVVMQRDELAQCWVELLLKVSR